MSGDGAGEQIDPALRDRAQAALAALAEADATHDPGRVVAFEQLEGGWSRHSYSMVVEDGGERLEYVVRVKPRGALLDTDLRQEYRTYLLLGEHAVCAPAVHALCERDDNPFDGPFFILTKAPGRAPNVWRRRDRAELEADWKGAGALGRDLVARLAEIHSIPVEAVAAAVPERSYAETVAHWRSIQEQMALVADPVIAEAYAWLGEREPEPVEPRLVHGDYRIGNCMIDEGRIVAILDWELAYFGDPRFDLGYVALDYMAGKFTRPGSELLSAVADRNWFMGEHEHLTGIEEDREVIRTHSVLGALSLIAILHTGVRMYADGKTDDIRMVWSRFAIPGLRQDVTHLLDW